jgi:ABC-type sugar transport system substrate-binding protein
MGSRSTGIALAAGVALSLSVAACGGSDSSGGGSSNSSASSASSSAGQSVGVMIKGLDNPFFAAMNDGVKAAGKSTQSKVQIQAAASLDDTSGQASKLEALIGQKMGCYVVNPTNLVQPLARVPDGTPVVNIDSPVGANAAKQAGLDISTYIGTDNVAAGGMAADTMADLVKGGGTIGVIGGVSGDATSVARVTGFTQGAKGRFKPLTTVAGDWDRAKALNAAEDLMRSNPDIKGFFAANDQMALGIAQAVKNAGKKGQIAIVGVDGIEDALKAVQAGDMSATVSQYPYTIGQLGVEACVAAAQGKKLPANVKAPVQVVTKANVAKAEQNFPEPVNAFADPFTALIGS